jgi:hypothetical protein
MVQYCISGDYLITDAARLAAVRTDVAKVFIAVLEDEPKHRAELFDLGRREVALPTPDRVACLALRSTLLGPRVHDLEVG